MKTARILASAILASLLALTPAAADIYNWSQTAITNTNSDLADDINLVEGMAPSEVNDSMRALMAEVRKWVSDMGATIPASTLMTTAGSANVQTLTTNGAASALTHGHTVCFIVGAGLTNTSSVTLNVDALGAKAVQGRDGTALAGGELAAGSLQCATYQSGDQVWLLHQFSPIDATTITFTSTGLMQRAALTGDVTASAGSNATTIAAGAVAASQLDTDVFTVPVGMVFDFVGTSCPSKSIAAYGQNIATATYPALTTLLGTTYGAGDGSNKTMPDLRGRVSVGEDDMGGVSANRLIDAGSQSLNGDTLGDTGGEEVHSQTEAEIPAHTHAAGTYAVGSHLHDAGTYAVGSHLHSADGTLAVATHTHDFGTLTGAAASGGTHVHDNGSDANNGSVSVNGSSANTAVADNGGSADTGSGGSHTHTVSVTGGATGSTAPDVTGNTSSTAPSFSGSSGSTTPSFSGSSGSIGSGTDFNVVQPSIVLTKCVYTGV